MQTAVFIRHFYLDYFETDAGRADADILGVSGLALEDMPARLYTLPATVDAEECKAIAARSKLHRRTWLAEQLLQPAVRDEAFVLPPSVEVNLQPDALLSRLEGLLAYATFYAAVQATLPAADTPLVVAQKALLAVHSARVNGLLCDASGAAQALQLQLEQQAANAQTEGFRRRLQAIIPHLPEAANDLAAADQLKALVQAEQQRASSATRPALSAAEIARLDSQQWNAARLKQLLETVLQAWGLLSVHKVTWEAVEARPGAAPDNLFQVVVRPSKASMAVSSHKRVMYVPTAFERSATSLYPAGALPVAAHELTHVLQALADAELAKLIPLAEMKGWRYSGGREAGAVFQENLLQTHYLGRRRAFNVASACAMLAKAAGGTQLAVIRAFYDCLTKGRPATEADRALSVDRALRLYRRGRHNTQPQDFVEQAEIAAQLAELTPEQACQFALAGSSFSPQDAVLLHQAGLLPLPAALVHQPAHDVMKHSRSSGALAPSV